MAQPFLDFPYHVAASGRTATTDDDDHIRDMIFQVLFASPGERVNRPDFGCGLKNLVFAPNSAALAASTQVLVRSALQKWLELEIQVEEVAVEAVETKLSVTVTYRKRTTGEVGTGRFTSP